MSPDLSGWLVNLLEAAVVALALWCAYEGTRRFAAQGFARFTALLVVVGLVVAVGEAGTNLYIASRLRLLLASFPAVAQAEPPGGWEKSSLSPAERTERSTETARLTFQVTGRIVDIVDASGARAPYVPTPDALRAREQMVLGFDRTEANVAKLEAEAWRRLVTVIVLMGAGWIVGRRARRAR